MFLFGVCLSRHTPPPHFFRCSEDLDLLLRQQFSSYFFKYLQCISTRVNVGANHSSLLCPSMYWTLWASAGALPEMKREGEVQLPHRCSSCLCCSEVGLKQQDAVLHWAGWDSVSKPGAAARQQGQDLEQEATNPRWLWVSAGFPREYHSSPMTKHSQVTSDGVVLTPLFLW